MKYKFNTFRKSGGAKYIMFKLGGGGGARTPGHPCSYAYAVFKLEIIANYIILVF